VRTGALLKALGAASAVRVRKDGFKIVPSREVMLRWFALNSGTSRGQPARPIGGTTAAEQAHVVDEVAREVRDQIVNFHRKGAAASRAEGRA